MVQNFLQILFGNAHQQVGPFHFLAPVNLPDVVGRVLRHKLVQKIHQIYVVTFSAIDGTSQRSYQLNQGAGGFRHINRKWSIILLGFSLQGEDPVPLLLQKRRR
uniref:(northern house mosquito) hypothetical protein n=1 Tax=Culex pipiens TaxID=7175 RepID=A0A8D8I5W0_CULPI